MKCNGTLEVLDHRRPPRTVPELAMEASFVPHPPVPPTVRRARACLTSGLRWLAGPCRHGTALHRTPVSATSLILTRTTEPSWWPPVWGPLSADDWWPTDPCMRPAVRSATRALRTTETGKNKSNVSIGWNMMRASTMSLKDDDVMNAATFFVLLTGQFTSVERAFI